MAYRVMRPITVDGQRYVWWQGPAGFPGEYDARFIWGLTVFLEGRKRSPLWIAFPHDGGTIEQAGYPEHGVLWFTDRYEDYNLNRPGVVAPIIRYMRNEGWDPESSLKPLVVANGWYLFKELTLPQGTDYGARVLVGK